MNIVLIGMMGSGKTTLGKELSKKTKFKFYDSDLELEKKYGKIFDIFEKNGEKYFRELESQIISNLSEKDNIIISTGGGVVLNLENIRNLQKNGKIVFLDVNKENLLKRICDKNTAIDKNTASDKNTAIDKNTPIDKNTAIEKIDKNILDRPLLKGDIEKNLNRIYSERYNLYKANCDVIIDNNNFKDEEVIDKILKETKLKY